jgi:hypothetical protein
MVYFPLFQQKALVVRDLRLEVFFGFVLSFINTQDGIVSCEVSFECIELFVEPLIFVEEVIFKSYYLSVLCPDITMEWVDWIHDFKTELRLLRLRVEFDRISTC